VLAPVAAVRIARRRSCAVRGACWWPQAEPSAAQQLGATVSQYLNICEANE
jgi:hypothetical protein